MTVKKITGIFWWNLEILQSIFCILRSEFLRIFVWHFFDTPTQTSEKCITEHNSSCHQTPRCGRLWTISASMTELPTAETGANLHWENRAESTWSDVSGGERCYSSSCYGFFFIALFSASFSRASYLLMDSS